MTSYPSVEYQEAQQHYSVIVGPRNGSNRPILHFYKNYHLFKVVENRMQQQCRAAHIVHSCQQYCSALLSLNQPAIRCNNAEQYC